MRVLHVIASMDPGGAEQMVLQFVADALARGNEAAVASAGGAWTSRLSPDVLHYDIPLIARSRTSLLAAGWRLRQVLRAVGPDIVHSHNVSVTAAARMAMAGRAAAPPLITTLHGLAHEDYSRASRVLARTGATVVGCAPSVVRALEANAFPAARRRTVVNGAARTPATSEEIEALRRALGLRNGRPVVLGLGRLVEQKSWPTLIAAAGALPAEVDVLVAGGGPLRPQLEELARQAGGRVRFVGVVDDVSALLGAVTCLVSTSIWEGLPLSLLEALSLGVPAVVTRVDGVVDVVPEGVAVLVEPGDPSAIAAALTQVLGDEALRGQLSQAARTASVRWSPETMLAAYQDVYAEALQSSRG